MNRCGNGNSIDSSRPVPQEIRALLKNLWTPLESPRNRVTTPCLLPSKPSAPMQRSEKSAQPCETFTESTKSPRSSLKGPFPNSYMNRLRPSLKVSTLPITLIAVPATVAAEDKYFFSHAGLRPYAKRRGPLDTLK